MNLPQREIGIALVGLVLAAVGIWRPWAQPAKVIEKEAPAVRQVDGSIILERTPTQPVAKPRHKLPSTAKLERVIGVDVKPYVGGIDTKALHVDLSLVSEHDGSKRVIASSPDGEIVGGLDIPVYTSAPQGRPMWAAGLNFDPIHQTPGVWIERDLSRIRVGVEVNMVGDRNGGRGVEGRVKVGIVF